MLKYLTRAMGALTPRTARDTELEGRRTYYREEQARIDAKRTQLREAAAGGDRKAATQLRQLAQSGAAGGNTDREQRLAAFCRLDDELFEQVERSLSRQRAEIAAIRASEDQYNGKETVVMFLDDADAERYAQLLDAKDLRDANAFVRERIANGYAVETLTRAADKPAQRNAEPNAERPRKAIRVPAHMHSQGVALMALRDKWFAEGSPRDGATFAQMQRLVRSFEAELPQ